MTRRLDSSEAFDALIASWLDERAHGPAADDVVDRVVARTLRTRVLPAWLVLDRWLPARLAQRPGQGSRLVPVLLLIVLALLAAGLLAVAIGSQRRLPPPFGPAAPGSVAFTASGHIWTANRDGTSLRQLTADSRIDFAPTFSRDGTRIAFKRLPVPNSKSDWQDWGDVIVANADGSHPVVIDADVHSPSPVTWSPDDRFIVYSRTVDGLDQVFVAASDGTSVQQLTTGSEAGWGPVLSPDGRTVAYVRGADTDMIGLYAIGIDGSSDRRLTTYPIDMFELAEWSVDNSSLMYGAITGHDAYEAIWIVGLDGRPERRLVRTSRDGGPTWSPDGRWIAFIHRLPSGENQVMVAGADGSNPRSISDPGQWSNPYWSPDARNVLAVDGQSSGSGGSLVAAIFDPFGTSPTTTFALPGQAGTGPPDLPGWQRRAP